MMKRMTRTSLGALMLTVVIPSAALSQNVTELEEINVVAEDADGVVEGYIATNTLSGSKTGTALVRLDQTVNVVPADQIEDQGAQSVAEALRYTPGVFTEYRGTSNLHDETYIRGFGYAPRLVVTRLARWTRGCLNGLRSSKARHPFSMVRPIPAAS